jgi:hypothetical protein
MAKKTFEITHKLSITSFDLREQYGWNLPHGYVDHNLWKKFAKVYDWDAILNSTKFSKYVNDCMKNDTMYADVICESYFGDHDSEFEKVKKAYDKFAAENKKKEPLVTAEYKLVIHGTVKDVDSALSAIEDITVVTTLEEVEGP